jgi:hypothetical protein
MKTFLDSIALVLSLAFAIVISLAIQALTSAPDEAAYGIAGITAIGLFDVLRRYIRTRLLD